ncbi:MAG: hypothetical protein EBS89_11615 [Proteobacteria bacterium]|nr:hypothetical protein [Pseudomonadota bacterium]
MNFDELWQKISEAIDPYDPALESRIKFKSMHSGALYKGKWSVDSPEGDTLGFEATAVKQEKNLPHTSSPMNAFGVMFEAKGGETTLTGRAGAAAATVYNGIIIFIRKVMDDQANRGTPVEALAFTAGEPSMLPVYERFVKMFLGDTFVRYDEKTLISKEAVERIRALSPEMSGDLDAQIARAGEEQKRKVAEIRAQRAILRGANPT